METLGVPKLMIFIILSVIGTVFPLTILLTKIKYD